MAREAALLLLGLLGRRNWGWIWHEGHEVTLLPLPLSGLQGVRKDPGGTTVPSAAGSWPARPGVTLQAPHGHTKFRGKTEAPKAGASPGTLRPA